MLLVPAFPFLSKIASSINPACQPANGRLIGLGLLQNNHLPISHYDQQLVPGLHSSSLAVRSRRVLNQIPLFPCNFQE